MAAARILLVEDERSIAEPLAMALEREGFETLLAPDAATALRRAREESPDLVLLDITLPDGDGRDVCRTLREDSDVPIVMLTARSAEADRIGGLALGADDYVVKPFSSAELILRIRAVLRRSRGPASSGGDGSFQTGSLVVDFAGRSASVDGVQLDLTKREFDLLVELVRHAGAVVTREQLMSEVWDINWFGSTKTLDVHVSSLRRKLGEDVNAPRFIHTVRGVGFRFAAPEELAP